MIRKFNDFINLKKFYPKGSFIKVFWKHIDGEEVFCIGKVNEFEGSKILCDFGIDTAGNPFNNDYLYLDGNDICTPSDEEIKMCKNACDGFTGKPKPKLDKDYEDEYMGLHDEEELDW